MGRALKFGCIYTWGWQKDNTKNTVGFQACKFFYHPFIPRLFTDQYQKVEKNVEKIHFFVIFDSQGHKVEKRKCNCKCILGDM